MRVDLRFVGYSTCVDSTAVNGSHRGSDAPLSGVDWQRIVEQTFGSPNGHIRKALVS